MKRSFMSKVQEQMQRLQIAAEVYLELGGDDQEPVRFTPTLGPVGEKSKRLGRAAQAQPLLVVRKREEAASEAIDTHKSKPPRKRKPGNHKSARATVLKIFLDTANKPMTSGEVVDRWPGRFALIGKARQPIYQALHEGKKAGFMLFNEQDRRYALSEEGLRMARGGGDVAFPSPRASEAA